MNIFKKMTLATLMAIGFTLMLPAETFAQECTVNLQGECVPTDGEIAIPPIPEQPIVTIVWVGYWYDRYGFLHSVSANTFTACNVLLLNATAGQIVDTSGYCVRQ